MRRLFWALILIAVVAGLYLLTPRFVPVVRGAGTVTPSGGYGGSGLQIIAISTPPAPVSTGYCGFTGTFTFNGGPNDPVGATNTATVSFTIRCNGAAPTTQTGSATYTITGTNEFTATAAGDPNGPLHGKVLASGDVVLLDGTTRNNFFSASGSPGTSLLSLIDYATLVRPQAQQF